MRAHRRRIRKATIAILLAVGSGGVSLIASAQPRDGTVQGELAVQRQATLTSEEQVRQADAISRRATHLGERLTRMLDEARRDKDIMRANCVNRKLTEVNANSRNVEQRSRALKDAVAVNDDARRSHEFTVLSVLSQKLDALDQEASQCLGQTVYEPGASQVITTVPGDAPSLDPTVVGAPPPPPPSVSVPPPLEPTQPVSPAM